MILIADSGSTKTDWRLIDEQKQIHQYATQGISPYFHTQEQIAEIIRLELVPQLKGEISSLQIFFYGTGCQAEDKKQVVKDALLSVFKNASAEIQSDMLGAARALCGQNEGMVAILGTGMNTCFYDGKEIVENKFSSGYILGDEGSGAHIGKTVVQAYLNDELPKALAERFYERFKLSKNDIIDAVYRKPMPNRFLSSFSKFVYQNLKEQYIIDLTANCFEQFFDKHICKYSKHKQVKLSCVGSVAFYYSNILRAVAITKEVNIDKIVETPIAGLTLYHLGEE
jgi:glucosamine kinase